jgi:membrane-associated protease RseP (regulator of RpoE activity)
MLPDTEILTSIVSRVLRIDDVTLGTPPKSFIVRYRGQLYGDSAAAYDQLADALRSYEITPLFRLEDGRHVVLLMQGVVKPRPANLRANLLWMALTVVSVFMAGAWYVYDGPALTSFTDFYRVAIERIFSGWPYAVSLLAILFAHEFGHYLVGRYHGAEVSFPYFLPLPFPGSFGTLGAFIQMKSIPKNRRHLLDIGIAGPLAGLIVAVPILLYGLHLSSVDRIPMVIPQDQGMTLEGNSILYLALKYIAKGELLPQPASYGGLHPALYWLRYIFTSLPLPRGGIDVMLHPVAWAGWAGLLVTALNLIPAGQLDGGHLMYVLRGRRAIKLVPFILGALFLLGFIWTGWWLWAFLIFIFGRFYAEPLDLITPLDPRRKALAILGVIIFILVFTPVPMVLVSGG